MRIAVYTSISDGYDNLKSGFDFSGADWYAFADCDQVGEWEVLRMAGEYGCQSRNSKTYKMHSHKYFYDYDVTVWIDGSFALNGNCNIREFVEQYFHPPFTAFKHPTRNCIHAEAERIILRKKEHEDVVIRQIRKYVTALKEPHADLIAGGVLMRDNSDSVKEFNKLWWHEILGHSKRDQLSFPYAVQESGIRVNYIPFSVRDIYFKNHSHLKKGTV